MEKADNNILMCDNFGCPRPVAAGKSSQLAWFIYLGYIFGIRIERKRRETKREAFALTDHIAIHIDTSQSDRGFQIAVTCRNHHLYYPHTILDVEDALTCALRLKGNLERECNVRIPDTDIRISQESIERNALFTENNLKAYSGIMTGKIKVMK